MQQANGYKEETGTRYYDRNGNLVKRVLHDVGVFTFAPDGSMIEDRGPKMLFSGETGKLCAALE